MEICKMCLVAFTFTSFVFSFMYFIGAYMTATICVNDSKAKKCIVTLYRKGTLWGIAMLANMAIAIIAISLF